MPLPSITSPIQYGLYALAKRNPSLFASSESFGGGMLAEDQAAIARVKALVAADPVYQRAAEVVAMEVPAREELSRAIAALAQALERSRG